MTEQTFGPRHLELMLSWRCNARCIHCWQTADREGATDAPGILTRNELTARDVIGLLQLYRGKLESVELCAYGEPTLHSELDTMLDAVADLATVNMTTNGSQRDALVRVAALPGYLTVSLDASTAKEYVAIRCGLSFDSVVDNIAHVVLHRHRERKIGINMVVHARNVDDIEGVAALAARLDVDYLAIIPGVALHYSRVLCPDDEIPAGNARVLASIAGARREHADLSIIDYYATPDGRGHADVPDYCELPWRMLSVDNAGYVHPCCRARRTRMWHIADGCGWRGAKIERLREQLRTRVVDAIEFPDCAVCPLRDRESRAA